MAIEIPGVGRTLIYDGLAQTDIDMSFHRLINLDTSNLPPVGIPPTVHPPIYKWLHDWDADLQQWTSTQPSFGDLSGGLTTLQMAGIIRVGIIRAGFWEAGVIDGAHLTTLDLIRRPVAPVSMNGFKITDLAMPTAPGDAVNLAYMDLLLQGLQPKEQVRVASLQDHARQGLGGVDGIPLRDGDRVLLKNQSDARSFQNGIWIAHSGAWTRATDCNEPAEFTGAYCTVSEGDRNAGTSWVQINPVTVVGTSPVKFVLFSSANNILPGAGLERVVNTLNVLGTTNRIAVGARVDIASNYAGQSSIHQVGTIDSGSWHGGVIDGLYGGTGVANSGKHITLVGDFTTSLSLDAIPNSSLQFNLLGPTTLSLPVSGTLVSLAGSETLTNKRIVKRTARIASNAKPAINVDSTDVFHITQLNESITSMTDNLTGTPSDGQDLYIWIRQDQGSAPPTFTIAWGSAFGDSVDLPLPTVTAQGLWMFMWFVYNDETSKWILTQNVNNITP